MRRLCVIALCSLLKHPASRKQFLSNTILEWLWRLIALWILKPDLPKRLVSRVARPNAARLLFNLFCFCKASAIKYQTLTAL